MTLRLIVTRIRVIWESLSTSYWFIPLLMMGSSAVICYTCLSVIERAFLPEFLRPLIPLVSQEGVQQLLSTVAGAMITVTSIAFSMTLVSLTLASNQFGPRLIRNFMHDRNTQAVLGILVSTFLFCLISLHHLSSISSNQDAISMLAGVTTFLALLDCVTIIYFIHHVSRSIQADHVIADCVARFESNIDSLLPVTESASSFRAITEQWAIPQSAFSVTVQALSNGYIQTINYDSFLNQTSTAVTGCELHVRSGDHILIGEALFTVYCNQPMTEGDFSELRKAVMLGASRTPIQDPEFAISQLVEVALRALSPGINDPNTAITCIDKLSGICMLIAEREFPAICLMNNDTQVWLKRRTFTFPGVIDTAFSQIRQMGAGHVAVLIHLLRNLASLRARCNGTAGVAIDKHAHAIDEKMQHLSLGTSDTHDLTIAMLPFKSA
ncbi:DUF2254 domain-containing protein [Alteromonas gilva]|uniref:DUF2254 domain-containing protein n=1 Tax=Alteromonas gilva TaxID=2987522 RepID=A0ABT5KZ08_9ALTE|nr:DUF2254 domain-containing protein [Alteromonas gilva]MDC8830005.1 DUF2254 domain-containing protein [Alteromonas gilva]